MTWIGKVGFFAGRLFLEVLGFELKASHLLLPLEPFHQPALGIFQIGSHTYAWAGLEHNPPINTSCVTGMTSTCHHTQLFIGIVSQTYCPRFSLNHDPTNLCLPRSWD
jgi:hypothetical protein